MNDEEINKNLQEEKQRRLKLGDDDPLQVKSLCHAAWSTTAYLKKINLFHLGETKINLFYFGLVKIRMSRLVCSNSKNFCTEQEEMMTSQLVVLDVVRFACLFFITRKICVNIQLRDFLPVVSFAVLADYMIVS